MAKYEITSDADIVQLRQKHEAGEVTVAVGDIIVHKPFIFAIMQGMMTKNFEHGVQLFPVMPGTEAYTLNGINTSVVEAIT